MTEKEVIYADNAATSILSEKAVESMLPYFNHLYGNPSSRHLMSKGPNSALRDARSLISNCINCDESEIYFTSGGTESDNWALRGIMEDSLNKHMITSSIEHPAIIETCKYLQSKGVDVDYVKVDSKGIVDIDELTKKIRHDTVLVSIMHVNNELGTIQNIKEISKIVHSRGILLHTDAVQSIGHIPINVKDMGVDLLSASGHKFNGPKGVGFLFCSKKVNIKPLLFGGHQQQSLRAGTENIPGIVGMAVALSDNVNHMNENMKHIEEMESMIVDKLKQSKIDCVFNGDQLRKIPGIISVSFRKITGEAITDILSMKNICVSTGSACNSKTQSISHVLTSIGLGEDYIHGTIRISLGKYNTMEEAIIISDSIIELVKTITSQVVKR